MRPAPTGRPRPAAGAGKGGGRSAAGGGEAPGIENPRVAGKPLWGRGPRRPPEDQPGARATGATEYDPGCGPRGTAEDVALCWWTSRGPTGTHLPDRERDARDCPGVGREARVEPGGAELPLDHAVRRAEPGVGDGVAAESWRQVVHHEVAGRRRHSPVAAQDELTGLGSAIDGERRVFDAAPAVREVLTDPEEARDPFALRVLHEPLREEVLPHLVHLPEVQINAVLRDRFETAAQAVDEPRDRPLLQERLGAGERATRLGL